MADRLHPWLRFFRIVNLPTVPGDVLAGALAMIAGLGAGSARPVFVAAAASCFAYLYGLADNDIVGAKTDVGRPIPNGEISLGAARVARALCWLAVPVLGLVGRLPSAWWAVMLSLFVAVSVYNRTKNAWLMGCCRGLNLLTGAAAVLGGVASVAPAKMIAPGALALLWSLYIGGVTKYSEGEETDPHKRAAVGALIGALVYLQLGALVIFALRCTQLPVTRPLLLSGAAMLLALRLMRRLLPKVSAS